MLTVVAAIMVAVIAMRINYSSGNHDVGAGDNWGGDGKDGVLVVILTLVIVKVVAVGNNRGGMVAAVSLFVTLTTALAVAGTVVITRGIRSMAEVEVATMGLGVPVVDSGSINVKVVRLDSDEVSVMNKTSVRIKIWQKTTLDENQNI